MTKVILSNAAEVQLHGLNEPTELYTTEGKVLGVFCPTHSSAVKNGKKHQSPYSREYAG
jgi:hypothetical protein